ncbi:DUF1836 domain-containing protein [Neobittarella massiliensis]|uniref:DUF1836 domain-containing protein n=1 Tax=Neobittarella massiliensis (ex Bilen et al. 2018) TaxID=2041842 RepID=UPI000CF727FE|nr:DUF1836 domain-containing protein [Neobittarella massiliensis]
MEKVTEIVQKALHREDMQLRDIPQIDLYMDQVLTLFSQHGGDNMLTKTMINNYRKEEIIRPLAGKKYTKNHIIQMLLIYNLKSVLSISQIGQVLGECYGALESDNALQMAYSEFLERAPQLEETTAGLLCDLIPQETLDDSGDLLAAVLVLSRLSQQVQDVAAALVEQHFAAEK